MGKVKTQRHRRHMKATPLSRKNEGEAAEGEMSDSVGAAVVEQEEREEKVRLGTGMALPYSYPEH